LSSQWASEISEPGGCAHDSLSWMRLLSRRRPSSHASSYQVGSSHWILLTVGPITTVQGAPSAKRSMLRLIVSVGCLEELKQNSHMFWRPHCRPCPLEQAGLQAPSTGSTSQPSFTTSDPQRKRTMRPVKRCGHEPMKSSSTGTRTRRSHFLLLQPPQHMTAALMSSDVCLLYRKSCLCWDPRH
jgi:hypothetical protein